MFTSRASKLRLCFFFLLWTFHSSAQDPFFSQAFSSGPGLNPGLTGETEENRAILQYRNQWPAIPGGITYTVFSLDRNLIQINSGIGFQVSRAAAGVGGLTSTTAALSYAYRLSLSRKWALRTGLRLGVTSRSVNFFSLTFPDQLGPDGVVQQLSNEDYGRLSNVQYLDIGWGAVAYSTNAWAGLAVQHLNRPDQSFFLDGSEPLPMALLLHAGYRINLQDRRGLRQDVPVKSLAPQIVIRSQGPFSQVEIGAILRLEPLWFGSFYRAKPWNSRYGLINQDALVLMAGLQEEKYTVGYSFDYTISALGIAAGGAHEISLLWHFSTLKSGKVRKVKRTRQNRNFYPGV